MSDEYVPVPYPTWRYHRTEGARLVDGPEADRALGPGWADSPAAFRTPEPEPAAPEPELEDDESEDEPEPTKKRATARRHR